MELMLISTRTYLQLEGMLCKVGNRLCHAVHHLELIAHTIDFFQLALQNEKLLGPGVAGVGNPAGARFGAAGGGHPCCPPHRCHVPVHAARDGHIKLSFPQFVFLPRLACPCSSRVWA